MAEGAMATFGHNKAPPLNRSIIFSFVMMNDSFPGVIVSPCKAGATGKMLSHLIASPCYFVTYMLLYWRFSYFHK